MTSCFSLLCPSPITTASCVRSIPIHRHERAENWWCWRWYDPGFPCTSLESGTISVISKPSCWLRSTNFVQQSSISLPLTVLNIRTMMVVIILWERGRRPTWSWGARGWLGLRGCLCRTEPKRVHCRVARAAARAPGEWSSFQSVLQPKETTKCASL